MKIVQFTAALLLFAQVVLAQPSEKYLKAMEKNLLSMDAAFKNPASLLALKKQPGFPIITLLFAR